MNSDSGTNVKYIDGIRRRTKADSHFVQVELPLEAQTTIVAVHHPNAKLAQKTTASAQDNNFYSEAVAQLNGTLPRLSRTRKQSNQAVLTDAAQQVFTSQPTKPSSDFAAKRAAMTKKVTSKASQLGSSVSSGAHKLVSKESFEQTAQRNPKAIRTVVIVEAVIIVLLIASVAALAVQYNNFRTQSNNALAVQKQQYETKWQGLEKQWNCIANQWQQYKADPKNANNLNNGDKVCQQ